MEFIFYRCDSELGAPSTSTATQPALFIHRGFEPVTISDDDFRENTKKLKKALFKAEHVQCDSSMIVSLYSSQLWPYQIK